VVAGAGRRAGCEAPEAHPALARPAPGRCGCDRDDDRVQRGVECEGQARAGLAAQVSELAARLSRGTRLERCPTRWLSLPGSAFKVAYKCVPLRSRGLSTLTCNLRRRQFRQVLRGDGLRRRGDRRRDDLGRGHRTLPRQQHLFMPVDAALLASALGRPAKGQRHMIEVTARSASNSAVPRTSSDGPADG
jgi:hypothetical protein